MPSDDRNGTSEADEKQYEIDGLQACLDDAAEDLERIAKIACAYRSVDEKIVLGDLIRSALYDLHNGKLHHVKRSLEQALEALDE